MNATAVQAVTENTLTKGDAIPTARIAGILAAKRVDELIPLCHTLPLSSVDIEFQWEGMSLLISATVATDAKTGVEMEALTACTVAALTVYDMVKSVDKAMVIGGVRLLQKSGGGSGTYKAEETG
jgi:cyclic pyranopterin monophosphate synthase